MKTITWVLEPDTFDDNPKKIESIALANGMKVIWQKYVPFSDCCELKFSEDDIVIPYCSVNMARQLRKYCWLDLPNLRCSTYHSYFGPYITQQCSIFTTWSELQRQKNFLYKTLGVDGKIFIKPDENTKAFCAQLVGEWSFDEWWNWVNGLNAIYPHSFVMVARPVEITNEYRFIVADRKVITGSQYHNHGNLCIKEEYSDSAYQFACLIAEAEWQPDTVYVLDVAESFLDDGSKQTSLLEFGSPNCAGIYACDVEKFVLKLSNQALRERKF